MRALPKRLSGSWQVTECDPSVEYLIEPPTARLMESLAADATIEIGADTELRVTQEISESDDGKGNVRRFAFDRLNWGAALLRVCLRGLRGVTELAADGGEEVDFELQYEVVRRDGHRYRFVTEECLDRLPLGLLQELTTKAVNSTGLLTGEEENADFTSGSSEAGSAAATVSLNDVPTAGSAVSPSLPSEPTPTE